MSSTRPQRRVSGSTRGLASKMPMDVIGRILRRHYGFARRDLTRGPASVEQKWVARPSEGGSK